MISPHNKIKFTNKKQFEALVSFMEKHPKLAKGSKSFREDYDKITFETLIQELANLLNNLGPPVREKPTLWLKVWSDYRLKIRQKLSHNQMCLLNDNLKDKKYKKLYSFSPLEERAIKAINNETTIKRRKKRSDSQSQKEKDEMQAAVEYIENDVVFKSEFPNKDNSMATQITENYDDDEERMVSNETKTQSELLDEEETTQSSITFEKEEPHFSEVYIDLHEDIPTFETLESRKKNNANTSNKQFLRRSEIINNEDRHDVFGKFIASELKRIKNECISDEVRWNIQVILRRGLQKDANQS